MPVFLAENIGTMAVGRVLAAVVVLIIRSLIKDKKAGKSTCGGSCGGCALNGSCKAYHK